MTHFWKENTSGNNFLGVLACFTAFEKQIGQEWDTIFFGEYFLIDF